MIRRVFLLLAGLAVAGGPAGASAAPSPAAIPAPAASPGSPSSVGPADSAILSPAPARDTLLDPRSAAADIPRGRADSTGPGVLAWLAALACAGVGAWLFVRGRSGRRPGRAGTGLSVADSRSLGNRQHLVVAAYGRKRFLIGVCQGSISLLSPLDDEPPSP